MMLRKKVQHELQLEDELYLQGGSSVVAQVVASPRDREVQV